MLLSILLAASLLPLRLASMHCVDGGADTAATQTQPLRGPGRLVAVLKVSSADDHGKNTHLCNAEYVLLITSGTGAARAVNLLTTNAEWGRTLSLKLDGFARNGKQVFGVLTERGKYPSTVLFDYDTAADKVQIIDLEARFAHIVKARCNTTFGVLGTTDSGAIVVGLSSAKACEAQGRWLTDFTGDSVHRLPQDTPVRRLVTSGAGVE